MPKFTQIEHPIRRKRQNRNRPSSSRPEQRVEEMTALRKSSSNPPPSGDPSFSKKTNSEPSLDWIEELISQGRKRTRALRQSSSSEMASIPPYNQRNVDTFVREGLQQNHVDRASISNAIRLEQSDDEIVEEVLKASKEDDDIERAFYSSPTLQNDPSSLPTFPMLVDITNILAGQESALQARKESSRTRFERSEPTRHSRRALMEHQLASDDNISSPSKRLELNWLEYLRIELKRSPDFFTSKEAKMEETGRIDRGGTGYVSLKLTQYNSADMREMYVLYYETKVNAGHSTGVYEQLKTVVGQFARFCCVVQLADYRKLCEVGAVYSLVAHMDAMRCFLQYFQLRSSPATVMTKCIHLKSLCDNAVRFHSAESTDRSCILVRNIRNVSAYLRSVHSVQKKETRRMAGQKKTFESRTARAVLFTENDYNLCLSKARERMSGIMSTYDRIFERKGRHESDAAVCDLGLVSKWCVNFLPALMLWGGGQRPQVYTQLLCPSASELEEIQRRAAGEDGGFIELRPLHEKTVRALDMPNVYFPIAAAPFICFHVEVVRRVILDQVVGSDAEGTVKDTLMLDTRNGRSLRTPQIKHTFSAFLRKIDPELCNVTPMSLRGSYATIMFSKYMRQEIFKGWTEDEFLRALAKSMNTSVEQLRTTYVGVEEADFDVIARQLTSVFEQNNHSNDSSDVSGNERTF